MPKMILLRVNSTQTPQYYWGIHVRQLPSLLAPDFPPKTKSFKAGVLRDLIQAYKIPTEFVYNHALLLLMLCMKLQCL